jgi:hypothetical protein
MDITSEAAIGHAQPILVTVEGDPTSSQSLETVPLDLTRFHSGRWALQLDGIFARRTEPAIILARGVACLAVAWWAQLSPRNYLRAVRGAVFASPLKIDFGQSAVATSALAGPHCRLPFPSLVASDATAPYVEQVLALADDWGSRFVDAQAAYAQHPSNRRAAGTGIKDALFGYLKLLDRDGALDHVVARESVARTPPVARRQRRA